VNKFKIIAVTVIATALLAGCSGYEKILKSKDNELKYSKALFYYNKSDFYRASLLLEQILPIYRGTNRADTVNYYYAYSQYGQGDYLLASSYFDSFRRNYPRSGFTEKAEYLYAYSFYLTSPRYELDQDNSILAIDAFQEFISKYPQSSKAEDAKKLVEELYKKLEQKEYKSAWLYYHTENYKAAIIALQNSLKDYPNSEYREEQTFLILKSAYIYADNSVTQKQKERFQSTVDYYYNFIAEFPNSKYLKEAQKMYEAASKVLKSSNN
jgi:outer membrane assembly lipoprotein YfiO